MSPIVDLLRKMRSRPALYIGGDSLVKLAAFLRGYSYALDQHSSMKTHQFLDRFREWVANRFSVTISQSWENIIQFQSADEKEAMQMFWRLLDEYLAQQETEG
jgi:hypothetical protein